MKLNRLIGILSILIQKDKATPLSLLKNLRCPAVLYIVISRI